MFPLTWAETDDGGSPITKYPVLTKQGSTTVSSTDVTGPAADINGLANGTVYTFTVTATNAVGTGVASVALSVTPIAGTTGTTSSSLNSVYKTVAWQSGVTVTFPTDCAMT